MTQAKKMICPDCGIEMNHHAEKIDYSVDAQAARAEFGGAVREVHCCPGCGKCATRLAEQASLSAL